MSESVLDQLVFQAMPLGEPLPKWPPGLDVQIHAISPAGLLPAGIKAYQQAAPLWVRRSPIASSDVNWAAFCGLLRDSGVLLQTGFSDMESLSDVNVPLRMARRDFDEGFDLSDLTSADTVLLNCVTKSFGIRCSHLPLETSGWHELKQLVESLRQVAQPGTPVGLGMLAGDIYTDVSNALAVRVDYVVLEFGELQGPLDNAALNHLAWGVVAARTACVQSGSPQFPILVDAPLTSVDHLIKLLALGATAVTIDAVIASSMPTAAPSSVPVPKGLLSGIGSLPVKATPNVQPIATKLEELLSRIRGRVYQQHLSGIGFLNRDHLRALDDRAARLCAVKMLEH
jgi:hypothetical protein